MRRSPRRCGPSVCRRWPSGSTRRRIGTTCFRSASSSGSAIARALLQKPDYLFLDEATASLDEPAEAALYRLLLERLPGATIVSIGHRSTLTVFHRRRLAFERDGEAHRVRESALEAAR